MGDVLFENRKKYLPTGYLLAVDLRRWARKQAMWPVLSKTLNWTIEHLNAPITAPMILYHH